VEALFLFLASFFFFEKSENSFKVSKSKKKDGLPQRRGASKRTRTARALLSLPRLLLALV
jgi:hypothetical protein